MGFVGSYGVEILFVFGLSFSFKEYGSDENSG